VYCISHLYRTTWRKPCSKVVVFTSSQLRRFYFYSPFVVLIVCVHLDVELVEFRVGIDESDSEGITLAAVVCLFPSLEIAMTR